jgi:hypothetical protein
LREITTLDRLLLLATGLLAAYLLAVGIDGTNPLATLCYSIAFGVLLLSGLLIIIFGYEILESAWVVRVGALIPLGLALGLIAQYYPSFAPAYALFAIVGWIAIAVTRRWGPKMFATITLAMVHGIAGLTIVFVPIELTRLGVTETSFYWVTVGGLLISGGGLLLGTLRMGEPLIPAGSILAALPVLLLTSTAAFVVGLA